MADATSGLAKTGKTGVDGSSAAGSSLATQQTVGLSQLSVSQSSEMLLYSEQPMAASVSNELLGAVLLMLMLEYMKSNDDEEKQGLLGLMGLLLQMQQQNGSQQSMLFYTSSSLSIESSQMQMTSGQAVSNAYTNAGVSPASGGDSSAALNVVA
jgi:hypothetical protein